MGCGGFSGDPGWGGHAVGASSDQCGPGFTSGGFGFDGPGFGGVGLGHGKRLKRAVMGTAAMLLDGPADAAQIGQRVSEATGGAFTPPREVTELAIEILAARGLVTVDGGIATLTELGNNILAWRGVTSHGAHAMMRAVGRFADVIKIRTGLQEAAGMARRIMWSGTDEQKAKLAEVRSNLAAAIAEANKALHGVLAES